MDKVSPRARSNIMRKIQSKDTKLELMFRRALWEKGLRYRKNVSSLFGKPDIAFIKSKTVIFIDSCFWHGCPNHLRLPTANKEYWMKKIERNKARDKEVLKYFNESGWNIIRIWEHELKDNINSIVKKISQIL